jgi:methylglutaconyl-CoA hydratase
MASKTSSGAVCTRATFSSDARQDLTVEYLDGNRAGIVVLGFNRPEAKNSFGGNLVQLLDAALDAVAFDKNVRSLIFRSTTPGMFCAGADLKERSKMPMTDVGMFLKKGNMIINKVCNLSVPVIAAMDGYALGKK